MTRKNIMFDLETLGTATNAVVTNVGFALFDTTGILRSGEYVLSVPFQMAEGRSKCSPSTLEWWQEQSDEAKAAIAPSLICTPEQHYVALQEISALCSAYDDLLVWGNGPTFDLGKMETLFRGGLGSPPWKFYNERCFRTAMSMWPVPRVRPTVAHRAEDDAVAQAQTLLNMHRQITYRSHSGDVFSPIE